MDTSCTTQRSCVLSSCLPEKAKTLANRAQKVATSNSAYRNLLYLANRDRKKVEAEHARLPRLPTALKRRIPCPTRSGIAAQGERLTALYETSALKQTMPEQSAAPPWR